MFSAKGITVKNYAGKQVVTGAGITFLFPCMLGLLPFAWQEGAEAILGYLMVVVFMPLLGMIDDILGDGTVKGLKGHIKVFISGGFSTGGVKALGAVIVAFFLSMQYRIGVVGQLLNIVIFPLFTNFINLLDLRPGRAIKAFGFFSVLLALITGLSSLWIFLPIIASLCVYFRGEMQEEYMMGDTGSNLLGGILGYYALKELSIHAKFIFTAFLLLMHWAAEIYSFSKWFSTVPILRYIDHIGMKRKEKEG